VLTLHYAKLSPTSWAATEVAVGYPASNVGLESIGRPWRSTTLGANDLTIVLPVISGVQTLFLHDVNFATCNIEKSVDGAVFVAVGALNTYADRHGRRRGYITIAAAGQKAVKIRIAAGATTDGLAFWRIGASYLFSSVLTPSAAVKYGYSARTKRPRVSTQLPNGLTAVATTGNNIDRLNLTFERLYSEIADDIIQKASAATCLLDVGLPNYPEQQWPVRCLEEDLEETFSNKNLSSIGVPLTEVV
jgi:hypothetical protein